MIKRLMIFIGVILLCASQALSQYAFTVFPLPSIFTLEDLWQFSVAGPNNGTYDQFQVYIRVYDGTNSLLVESSSQSFVINGGSLYVNKLNLGDLQPLQHTYSSPALQSMTGNGGYFPAGMYNFQYQLLGRNAATGNYEILSEQLGSQTVDLLYPPTLLTPSDNDTLEDYYPVFTWAPAFSGNGERIFYDIIIVEQLPTQTAEQAVNSNPAWYEEENLSTSALPYPVSAPKFKTNQWYAWRVTANVNGQPLARSESWRFIITEAVPDSCKIKPAAYYYEMKDKTGSAYATVKGGQLNFSFTQPYYVTVEDLQFTITNSAGLVVATEKDVSRKMTDGFNRFTLLLCSEEIDIGMGNYMLEVTLEKDKKLLPFKVIDNQSPCE